MESPTRLNSAKLAELIRERCGHRSLRSVAPEIGISISTLSRIGRAGNLPDVDTLLLVCQWLGVTVESLTEAGTRWEVHLKSITSADDLRHWLDVADRDGFELVSVEYAIKGGGEAVFRRHARKEQTGEEGQAE